LTLVGFCIPLDKYWVILHTIIQAISCTSTGSRKQRNRITRASETTTKTMGKNLCQMRRTQKLLENPGPKFTDDLRAILRQFPDLRQSCDNWRIHRTFTAVYLNFKTKSYYHFLDVLRQPGTRSEDVS